jgi:hypothetical protein
VRYLALALILLLLVGCGEKEALGMKAEIQVTPDAPEPESQEVIGKIAGELLLELVGDSEQEEILNLLATNLPESKPAGQMRFTRLVIINRQMEHPARASIIIEANIHWQPADGNASAVILELKTHSVPLEQPDTQIPWLREQACKGMWKRLFKAL